MDKYKIIHDQANEIADSEAKKDSIDALILLTYDSETGVMNGVLRGPATGFMGLVISAMQKDENTANVMIKAVEHYQANVKLNDENQNIFIKNAKTP